MLYTSAFTSLKRISNMTLKSYLALITVTTITLIIVAATLVFGYVLRSAYLDNLVKEG